MQVRNVPATGPRYWAAISIASVFGANFGDFVSHDLRLGHVRGLLPLALVFAAILLAERRSRRPVEAYYWLAIVTLRTAATNLADLATHDLRLGYGWVITGLAAMLLASLALAPARQDLADALPPTDGRYWASMLIAGTLGTAIGDAVADDLSLGVALASGITVAVLTAMLGLRARLVTVASYWATIVAVRTAGTNVGDLSAQTLGLPASTAVSGLLLVGLLLAWRREAPVAFSRA